MAATADDTAEAAELQRQAEIVRDYWAKAFPFQPQRHVKIGCDTGTCASGPWRCPSQAPFRRQGQGLETVVPEPGRIGGQRVDDMLRRVSDQRACLEAEAPGEQGCDLTQVRRSALRTDLALEVCLFRLADALRDPDRAMVWFEAQGFSAYAPQDRSDPGWRTLRANWRGNRALLPRLSTTHLLGLPTTIFGFAAEGRVRGVELHRNPKLGLRYAQRLPDAPRLPTLEAT